MVGQGQRHRISLNAAPHACVVPFGFRCTLNEWASDESDAPCSHQEPTWDYIFFGEQVLVLPSHMPPALWQSTLVFAVVTSAANTVPVKAIQRHSQRRNNGLHSVSLLGLSLKPWHVNAPSPPDVPACKRKAARVFRALFSRSVLIAWRSPGRGRPRLLRFFWGEPVTGGKAASPT